ncbi:UAA transporter [Dendrothele bispora CBS 962.96]|uniref:UDP-galactose transporter homolog 1 n=1 Tax=Dendrothele bispora (strain CBS 962.96) TaxID=1314807 RepID=A0A4S8MMQ5_DENBC|nr:UAA transporter [Dendrothele bispora CBS 962.96]
MSFLRLIVCVSGVYSMFLLWAIAQERLSVPFKSIETDKSDKFRSALFLGLCQSTLSSLSALIYILVRKKPEQTFLEALGIRKDYVPPPSKHHTNGSASNGKPPKPNTRYSPSSLLLSYLQTSFFITTAAPFGFAALSYISYPAMVLGKSCKLVPVMIMNVLLYRRKFAPHKYIVVAMVTTGITIFMGFGGESSKKHKSGGMTSDSPYASLIGITYLLINLALDGAINSTQDEIFSRYQVTGQQMMLFINLFCTLISLTLSVLPLPYIPVIHETPGGKSEMAAALEFIRTHPGILRSLLEFSVTGALGQLFIFETLKSFGSLTLVMITLTRKMFTMILSVVVYNHQLTLGQWAGAAVVFGGISVEAFVKRKEIHAKRILQEKEKAKLKSL